LTTTINKISALKKTDIDISKLDEIYNKKASCLFEKLCEIKPSLRYQCSNALIHPWITKDENGIVPLNFHDQIEKTNKMFDKFMSIQNLVLSIAILRDRYSGNYTSHAIDEYKYQITKEEFLDFTPTPKKINIEAFNSFGKQISSDSDQSK